MDGRGSAFRFTSGRGFDRCEGESRPLAGRPLGSEQSPRDRIAILAKRLLFGCVPQPRAHVRPPVSRDLKAAATRFPGLASCVRWRTGAPGVDSPGARGHGGVALRGGPAHEASPGLFWEPVEGMLSQPHIEAAPAGPDGVPAAVPFCGPSARAGGTNLTLTSAFREKDVPPGSRISIR